MATTTEFSVKVSGVPQGTTADELHEVFKALGFAGITDVYLPQRFAKFEFGFVRFSNMEEAQQAADMQDLRVRGASLSCEPAVNDKRRVGMAPGSGRAPPPPAMLQPEPMAIGKGGGTPGEYSVWVGSLPAGATPDQLREALSLCGIDTTTDVYIPPGRDFGFVRFGYQEEAERALQLSGILELRGSKLEMRLSTTEKRSVPGSGPPAAEPRHGGDRWGGSWQGPPIGACANSKGGSWREPGPVGGGRGSSDWNEPSGYYGKAPTGHSAKAGRAAAPWDAPYAGGGGKPGAPAPWDGPSARGGLSGGGGAASAPVEYSIWVGMFTKGTTSEQLDEAFRSCGVETMTDTYVPPGKEFGFVRFASWEEADEALCICRGMQVMGRDVELKLSRTEKRNSASVALASPATSSPQVPVSDTRGKGWPRAGPGQAPPAPPPAARDLEISVKVSGLGANVTSEELESAFKAAGVDSMTDVYIPRGRNFGFVRFRKISEAHAAIALAGMQVGGSRISCEMAEGDKRSSDHFVAQAPSEPRGPPGGGYSPGYGGGYGAGSAPIGALPGAGGKGWQSARTDEGFKNEVSVKVGNLPADVTPDEICEAFAAQGIDTMKDCYVPHGRRFGFVRFSTAAEGRYALQRQIWVRSNLLELEPAMGTKRTPDEMLESEQARQRRMAPVSELPQELPEAPRDPNTSPDAPSVKVSGMPAGASSQELHAALLEAGLGGKATDVYVPRGNRGFGFVRFATPHEAEAASRLQPWLRGARLSLELAVQERRAPPAGAEVALHH